MKILAIESSCDETAAAMIEKTDEKISILSNIVASQIEIHKKYGGVYPEIASRAHTEKIIEVIEEAIQQSNNPAIESIDLIAVTTGPGLIGSLLVGVNAAKTLAYSLNKPIIPINHWLGHVYSCWAGEITNNQSPTSKQIPNSNFQNTNNENLPKFPILALIVSGGHTGLVLMESHTEYKTIGQTLDDAAGEAFDKVAKLLGLGYPGGPAISEAAARYKIQDTRYKESIKFPRAMLDRDNYDFSFSGIKTSVLNKVKELTTHYPLSTFRSQVAYEFQQCVIDILIGKTIKAAEEYKPKSILLCGGVSANKELREQMATAIEMKYGVKSMENGEEIKTNDSYSMIHTPSFHVPPMELTGDNAAMIGIAAAYQISNCIKPTTFDKIDANSNLKLG